MPLAVAEKQPLTTERLSEQLGRLGGTPFKLGAVKNALPDNLMLSFAQVEYPEINRSSQPNTPDSGKISEDIPPVPTSFFRLFVA